MKKYTLKKNGRIEHIWDSNTGDETYHEPSFGISSSYTVEIEDVTAELAFKKKREVKKAMLTFGESIIVDISLMNESKQVSFAQVEALMTNPLLGLLREHLWAGNIPSFVDKLSNSDVSAFFTNLEKQALLSKCMVFLQGLE